MAGQYAPLLHLPDSALEAILNHLGRRRAGSKGPLPEVQALLNTCSQLRKQVSQFIDHTTFSLDDSKDAVATFVRGWPRHAVVKSIEFQCASNASKFGLSSLSRHVPAPFRLDRLERVALSCTITQSDMFVLAALCPSIKQLHLGTSADPWNGSPLKVADGRFLQPLSHMPSLNTLDFITPEFSNYGDEDSTNFLDSLLHLPTSLTSVSLKFAPTAFNPLVLSLQEALLASCSIPGLRLLHVPFGLGTVHPAGAEPDYFSPLLTTHSLEELHWAMPTDSEMPFGEMPETFSPHALPSLLHCVHLRRLTLDLKIEGPAAVSLMSLPKLESLCVRMLSFPEQQEPGQAIQRHQPLQLTVTDDDLHPLLRLPAGVVGKLLVVTTADPYGDSTGGVSIIFISSAEEAQQLLQLAPILQPMPPPNPRLDKAAPWSMAEEAVLRVHLLPDLQLPPSFLASLLKVPGVEFRYAEPLDPEFE